MVFEAVHGGVAPKAAYFSRRGVGWNFAAGPVLHGNDISGWRAQVVVFWDGATNHKNPFTIRVGFGAEWAKDFCLNIYLPLQSGLQNFKRNLANCGFTRHRIIELKVFGFGLDKLHQVIDSAGDFLGQSVVGDVGNG